MEALRQVLSDHPEIECLDGRRYPKVSPKRTHALVQKALLQALDACAGERGEVAPEWRFKVGMVDGTLTEFVPDVAFVSYERLGKLTDQEAEEPPFAPNIAIEIRSPSDKSALIRLKVDRYLKTGSDLVLDADPESRTIVAHSVSGAREFTSGERFVHPAAPWFIFQLETIFPGPRTGASK